MPRKTVLIIVVVLFGGCTPSEGDCAQYAIKEAHDAQAKELDAQIDAIGDDAAQRKLELHEVAKANAPKRTQAQEGLDCNDGKINSHYVKCRIAGNPAEQCGPKFAQ